MPRSRKVLASAGAGTGEGASAGKAMTASGGLIAFAAAAIAPGVSVSLTAATGSRLSSAAPRTISGCGKAAVTSTDEPSATLAVPSDIADVVDTWLNAV